MKYIKEFHEYEPETDQVSRWFDYIQKNYIIGDYHGNKYIMVDEKPQYLSGYMFNKGKLTNLLFWDIKSSKEESKIHDPSLRKAIKEWIDSNRENLNESKKDKPNFKKVEIDGFLVYYGKDASANEWVTFELSSPEDYWFHAKGVPGSHVLIKVKDKIPTKETIKKVAQIAAKNSQSGKEEVLVVYCKKKFVTKKQGDPVGKVVVDESNSYKETVPKN